MSRIGKQSIVIPSGVEVIIDGRKVTTKGPKGTLEVKLPLGINVELKENTIAQLSKINCTIFFNQAFGIGNKAKSEAEVTQILDKLKFASDKLPIIGHKKFSQTTYWVSVKKAQADLETFKTAFEKQQVALQQQLQEQQEVVQQEGQNQQLNLPTPPPAQLEEKIELDEEQASPGAQLQQ